MPNQWKIQILNHVENSGGFLSFQMVLAFLWSRSRCPHDAADSDHLLCIYCRQVSCRSVTYSELCKNPSISWRQGQNKTHCCIYKLGCFLLEWKSLSFIYLGLYVGVMFSYRFFFAFNFSPTIYRNTKVKLFI